MAVSYDGKKIIPAPQVNISRREVQRDDGKTLGYVFDVSLRGKMVAWKGSPTSSGVFWTSSGYPSDESISAESRLGAILRKQEALRKLFSRQGAMLEFQPYDGSAAASCQLRNVRIDFPEGLWFEYCDYTITAEADSVTGLYDHDYSADLRISRESNDWSIDILDETKNTYRLTHSVSATGRRLLDTDGDLLDGKEPWEHARDHVLDNIGLGLVTAHMQASGVLNASGLQAFNYLRSTSVNEYAGTFSCNESWVAYDPQGEPPAINEYNVNIRESAQENRTSVTVEGTITGLEVRNNNTHALISTRWQNALNKWNAYVQPYLLTTAQALASGTTLHPVPLTKQTGMNELAGTISYTYEYDNRATPSIAGAITETITIADNHAADVFAQVPILGRAAGPILQGMDTVTAKKRNVSIEAQLPGNRQGFTATRPDTSSLVLSFAPSGASQTYVENDDESWTPNTGRYTRNTTFVWQ